MYSSWEGGGSLCVCSSWEGGVCVCVVCVAPGREEGVCVCVCRLNRGGRWEGINVY